MGRLHFVYSIPNPTASVFRTGRRGYEKIRQYFPGIPPWYRAGWLPSQPNPLHAPASITVNLFDFLRKRTAIRLYDWRERNEIRFGPTDIILGHPHPNPDTVIQKAFLNERRCRLKALIFPLHHAIPSINEYAIPLLDRADIVFGIMGKYWYDTLDESFLSPWKSKIVRLDMAVDTTQYPLVKRRFNPAGQRGYLYIGSNLPEKGVDVLSRTLSQLPEFTKGWVGGGPDIPGIPRISEFTSLTPTFVEALSEPYDFFVNTSVSDANPTAILEAMAWGFPVACTPQSGYYRLPSIVQLSTTDINANVEALLKLQYAPEKVLHQLSATNRKMVESEYTWGKFCATVWQHLSPFL